MWLNNCVGKRNYRPFFTFIFATAILCLFVILSAIYHLHYISKYSVDQPPQFSAVFAKAPVSFVLAIICFILLWLVGGLTLFHCSLLLKGITTHEQVYINHPSFILFTQTRYIDTCSFYKSKISWIDC